MEVREHGTRVVVLVEGESDRNALLALAERRGLDLAAAGVAIEPVGGAQAMGRAIERFGPGGAGLGVAALYDAGEERAVARCRNQPALVRRFNPKTMSR